MMLDVNKELSKAVSHFWLTRNKQKNTQGSITGAKDAGNRGAVTGGKHADGFVELIANIVHNAGLPKASIHSKEKKPRTIPGYFRPTKEWDIVVTNGNNLVAAIEVKSQVGSFGNNFNNRVEEALGNATDFWASYKKGILKPSSRPWLGYLFMLEDHENSTKPTERIVLSPFKVDDNLQSLSYAERYEELCLRMVRELLYDSACFFTSNSILGEGGKFNEPNAELSIRNFSISLHARAAAFAKNL
jgi:hypothetical protein